MGKLLIQFCLAFILSVSAFQVTALTDTYYATGEDLDFLIDSDNSLVLEEIEYELRRFVIFRKVEDYLFNLSDSYFDTEH